MTRSPDRKRATVITVSDRRSAGVMEDRSGPRAQERVEALGYLVQTAVVPDEQDEIRVAVTDAAAKGHDLILTLGGTGIGPRDRTPEAVIPLLDVDLPGVAEALRERGRRSTPTAALSRGCAGVIGSALIVALPGSPHAVEECLEVLQPILEHAHDQLAGGDH